MRGFSSSRLWLALLLSVCIPTLSQAANANLVSTMRNVNAVMEANGFRINPAFDQSGQIQEGDLAPVQAFEILRPDGKAFSIGRLYTSCVCVQLESPKRNFAEGERAILRLRNVKPTPTNGQIYAIYVQITSPIRTTLRFDTFVQSNHPGMPAADAGEGESASPAPIVQNPLNPEVYGDPGKFEVIVPSSGEKDGAEKKDEGEKKDDSLTEEAEQAAERVGEAAETAAVTVDAETESIKAEAEARVEAAKAAAGDMAASMDSYFDELSDDMPKALPPPALEDADTAVPAAPDAEKSSDETAAVPPEKPIQGGIAGSLAASGTRLEEVYHASSSGRLASAVPENEAAPVKGAKKPLRNVSLITIGVKDLARSMRFYEALGWEMAPRGKYDQTAFFQLNGQVLVLYPMPEMLKEQNMENAAPAPGGITLAIHVGDKDDVYSTYQSFIDAGGASLKEPTETLSGSVTSYVADPDGNPWEISWVPQFRVDQNGWLWLP